jgi:hypothetical protein
MLVIAALLFGATCWAEKIPRQDNGVLDLTFGPPQSVAVGALQPGETAWQAMATTGDLVRMKVDAPARIRPGRTEGPKTGEVLFGLGLRSGGKVYCPFLDIAKAVRRVQCLRDIDGDFTFDGAYITENQTARSGFGTGWVGGLTPVRKLAYEAAPAASSPSEAAEFRFRGWTPQGPTFRLILGRDRPRGTFQCEMEGAERCRFLDGLVLTIARGDGQQLIIKGHETVGPVNMQYLFVDD